MRPTLSLLFRVTKRVFNHYKTLDVPQSASQDEIKKKFYELAKKYHPDVNPSAKDTFTKISAAYHVLGDPSERKTYDMNLRYGGSSSSNSSARNRPSYSQSYDQYQRWAKESGFEGFAAEEEESELQRERKRYQSAWSKESDMHNRAAREWYRKKMEREMDDEEVNRMWEEYESFREKRRQQQYKSAGGKGSEEDYQQFNGWSRQDEEAAWDAFHQATSGGASRKAMSDVSKVIGLSVVSAIVFQVIAMAVNEYLQKGRLGAGPIDGILERLSNVEDEVSLRQGLNRLEDYLSEDHLDHNIHMLQAFYVHLGPILLSLFLSNSIISSSASARELRAKAALCLNKLSKHDGIGQQMVLESQNNQNTVQLLLQRAATESDMETLHHIKHTLSHLALNKHPAVVASFDKPDVYSSLYELSRAKSNQVLLDIVALVLFNLDSSMASVKATSTAILQRIPPETKVISCLIELLGSSRRADKAAEALYTYYSYLQQLQPQSGNQGDNDKEEDAERKRRAARKVLRMIASNAHTIERAKRAEQVLRSSATFDGKNVATGAAAASSSSSSALPRSTAVLRSKILQLLIASQLLKTGKLPQESKQYLTSGNVSEENAVAEAIATILPYLKEESQRTAVLDELNQWADTMPSVASNQRITKLLEKFTPSLPLSSPPPPPPPLSSPSSPSSPSVPTSVLSVLPPLPTPPVQHEETTPGIEVAPQVIDSRLFEESVSGSRSSGIVGEQEMKTQVDSDSAPSTVQGAAQFVLVHVKQPEQEQQE